MTLAAFSQLIEGSGQRFCKTSFVEHSGHGVFSGKRLHLLMNVVYVKAFLERVQTARHSVCPVDKIIIKLNVIGRIERHCDVAENLSLAVERGQNCYHRLVVFFQSGEDIGSREVVSAFIVFTVTL